MKNVFVSVLVLFLSAITMNGNAQIQEGQFELGLDLSASTGGGESEGGYVSESDFRGLRIGPRIGYFVTDKVQIGLSSSFYNRKNTDKLDPSVSKSSSWAAGPFASYYHEVEDRLYLRGTFASSYGQRKRNFTGPLSTDFSDGKSFNTSLGLGVTYATKGKLTFGLNMGSLVYSNSESRRDIGEAGESKSTSSELSLNILSSGNEREFSDGLVNISMRLY